jgi:hypothetical protein
MGSVYRDAEEVILSLGVEPEHDLLLDAVNLYGVAIFRAM